MPQTSAHNERRAPTALVVDDDAATLELLAEVLQDAGFTPTCFTRGQPALATLAAQSFDLLLIDLWLPDLKGFALCQAARDWYGDAPTVMLITADQRVTSWITALDLGADDCLGKPFDIEELLARIGAKRRRRDEAMGRGAGATTGGWGRLATYNA
jgi:DNA-binding response OmpR family regulator